MPILTTVSKTDFDFILGEIGVSIRYHSFSTGGIGSWLVIKGAIDEGEIGGLEEVGFVDEGMRRPVFVSISKTDIEKVRCRKDEVELNGTIYGVKGVVFENDAQFQLYCRQ